ncbi:ATP synthase F1 subunit epsilon [Leyella stercorea]|uniref:ATP synthase F1 subunit epsilon n=1 Tax=Leyella stercorea TaxID=363265 RepID=UPI001A4BBE04|nr:ATP synthase F1 subunit epsilon [Leyella stercorea]MBL6517054.1 ATP synthase F1 subunit epsilon [Leyella stercorea]
MSLNLKIVSPEKVAFDGAVERVVVPGTSGEFEILTDHAPIISTLEKGKLVYQDYEGRHELMVNGGFVEVQKNNVNICVEL